MRERFPALRGNYDDWKTTAPDTGSEPHPKRPCAVCGLIALNRLGICACGATPRERDAAANAKRGPW